MLKVYLSNGQFFQLGKLESSMSVFELKQRIEAQKGIRSDQQIITMIASNQKVKLEDEKQLFQYGLIQKNENTKVANWSQQNEVQLVVYQR